MDNLWTFNKHIQHVILVLCMFQNRQRWRNRRSQRLDKMELLTLQSSLQSEIQAKSQIAEELSKIKSSCVTYEKLVIYPNILDFLLQIT